MSIHRLYARVSPMFRRRRLRRMLAIFGTVESVLDVGGLPWCWDGTLLPREKITLLNPSASTLRADETAGFAAVVAGDGCALPFADRSFDVVFSNSVIEHVGSWERQQAFAREARRVGRRLWVQTPAREFFVEPHLVAPFIHWLPRRWQRRLVRRGTLRGWMERPDGPTIETWLDDVRLLSAAEMHELFPDCRIARERFLGLTKSHLAVRTAS